MRLIVALPWISLAFFVDASCSNSSQFCVELLRPYFFITEAPAAYNKDKPSNKLLPRAENGRRSWQKGQMRLGSKRQWIKRIWTERRLMWQVVSIFLFLYFIWHFKNLASTLLFFTRRGQWWLLVMLEGGIVRLVQIPTMIPAHLLIILVCCARSGMDD